MRVIQDFILQDEAVARLMRSQGKDGWLGWQFHGYDSMESNLRLLCEKGVEASHPVVSKALLGLEKHTDRLERGLGRAGSILDELRFGGGQTIRASLFALAGKGEPDFVKEQIRLALDAFRFTIQIHSWEEVCQPYQENLVFRKDTCWPSIYHLRLLAWTQSWQTSENHKMMVESIRNLIRLSPLPAIHVKYKSQLIAPASFCMHHFTTDMNSLSVAGWMQWFHRMELFSRLGVVDQIPHLQHQVETLKNILGESHGLFTKKLLHPYFQKWGAYTGLALEKDWRSPARRIYDLTFRSLLILNYSGM